MIEQTVDIPTKDGKTTTFIVHPDRGGPFPVILFYMDAPAIREELRDMARRLAASGYYVVLPNMYYRAGVMELGPIPPAMDAPERKKMQDYMNSLTIPLVMDDTAALLAYVDGQAAASKGAIGCVGYCMSGQYVVAAAGTYPHKIVATASLYGVGIVTDKPDSPHLLAPAIKGELYLGFAAHDPWVPDNVIPDLTRALDAAGVAYECEIHPDTEHGFCFPQRPAYVKDRAEIAWDKMMRMYERRLKPASRS
jgi:carboxymethylenebutenolidase